MRPLSRAGLALAVAGAALAWTPALHTGFVLPKLLAVAVGLAAAAGALAAGPEPFPRAPELERALAAGLAVLAVCAFCSMDPRASFEGRYNDWTYGVWPLLLDAGLALAAVAALRGVEGGALRALALLGAVLGAHALAQKADLDPFIRAKVLPHGGRAVAWLGSPVDLGALLALLFPCALHAAAEEFPWALAAAATAGGLWATGSRGAWLGAAVGGGVLVLVGGAPRWTRSASPARRLQAAALLAALVLAASAWAFRPSRDVGRWEVWKAAVRTFARHPLLGTGPDTFELAFRREKTPAFVKAMGLSTIVQAHAHSDILDAAATTGLAGLAAYAWLLAALWAAARRALADPARRGPAAAAGGALVALFVNLKFNPVSLEVLAPAAVLAGLLWASAPKPRPAPRALPAALALVGLLSAALIARIWAAERHAHAADEFAAAAAWEPALAERRAALDLRPCELAYAMALVNDLGPALNADRDVERRRRLLGEGASAGMRAVLCHPEDSSAHYTRGVAELFHGQLGIVGRLETSAEELDAALAGDPWFEPLLRSRIDVARRRGDDVTAGKLAARLAELQSLTAH